MSGWEIAGWVSLGLVVAVVIVIIGLVAFILNDDMEGC